jgi:hypothetical protein
MSAAAATNGTHLREKVAFPTNMPVTLGLEFDPPAEPRPGRFGDQYMYWLEGNQVAWLEPEVHQAILDSGARAGDAIAITKREVRQGNKRRILWEVERADAADEQFVTTAQPTSKPAARASAACGGAGVLVSQPRPQPAPQPAPVDAPQQPTAAHAEALRVSLIAAVDAAIAAEAHAKNRSFNLRFDPREVQALASTMFIALTGGRR